MGVAEKIARVKEERARMERRKKRRVRLFAGFLVVAIVVCAVSVGFAVLQWNQKGPNEATLVSVRQLAGTVLSEEPDRTEDRLSREIDFDALQAENPDAVRWLWMPGTQIDTCVMQEQKPGEYPYLSTDFYGQDDPAGSLLTVAMPSGYEDAHLLIFGKQDGAFFDLRKYRKESYAKDHSEILLYYPDRSEVWTVWAAALLPVDHTAYQVPYLQDSEEYGDMLEDTASSLLYELSDAPSSSEPTLYLSTCGTDGRDRLVLVCTKQDEVSER